MKKVMFTIFSFVLFGQMNAQNVVSCDECFDVNVKVEEVSRSEIKFKFDYEDYYDTQLIDHVNTDNTFVQNYHSDLYDENYNVNGYWFTIQNEVLNVSNGEVHSLNTFMTDEIVGCGCVFVKNNKNELVKTIVLGCTKSVWIDGVWYSSDIGYGDVKVPKDMNVFVTDYVDFQ